MLNPAKLKSSFDRTVKRVKRAAFVITFSTLSSFPSFVSRVEAIEPATANEFRGLAKQAIELLEEHKTVNPDGTVDYDVPKGEVDRLEREFKRVVDKLKKEVDKDIKNQEWARAERIIGLFYNFLREMHYVDIAEDLLELRNKIHDDFVSHVDMGSPGIYTIQGSGKVYVISEGSSRMMSMARTKAGSNARLFLVRYLNARSATVNFFGLPLNGSAKEKKGVHKFRILVGFHKGGRVVLDDGTELSEFAIAEMLERDRKFLPLD